MDANPTVTVLLPSEDADSLVQEAVRALNAGGTILDLTAGRVGGKSLVRDCVGAMCEEKWIDGRAYESDLAESAQAEHVRWLAGMADAPLWRGASLKELFVYSSRSGRRMSLWWLSGLSRRGLVSSPYTWIFYSLAVIGRVRSDCAPRRWMVVGNQRACAAVASWIGSTATLVPLRTARTRSSWDTLRRTAGLVRRLFLETRGVGGRPAKRTSKRRVFLLQSCYANRWVDSHEAGVDVEGVNSTDKYYGDLPWKLDNWGGEVVWLPLVSTGDQDAWNRVLSRQTLPDARAYMSFGTWDAVRLLAQSVVWWWTYAIVICAFRVDRKIRYEGAPLGGWLRDELWMGLWGGYTSHLVLLERQRRAIEHYRPDVVIHRNDFLVQGRVTEVAATGVAEAVALQHGLLTQTTGVYQYDPSEIGPSPMEAGADFVRYCPMPDRLAAFGPYTQDYFRQWSGYSPERVFVTGGVRHDALVRAFSDKVASRAMLKLPESGRIVACCVTYPEEVDRVVPAIGSALVELNDVSMVVIKPHPDYDTSEQIEALGREHLGSKFTCLRADIYHVVSAADVLVSGPSTVTLEAYLLQTPVVTVGSGSYEAFPYSQEEIGTHADSPADLAGALREALDAAPEAQRRYLEDRRRVLERHLHNADAGACQRLANAIGLDVPPL